MLNARAFGRSMQERLTEDAPRGQKRQDHGGDLPASALASLAALAVARRDET
jgi:hypothetical protein